MVNLLDNKEHSFDAEKLIERYEPDFAVAYGSGVFRQEGYSEDETPMIDFIFGVDSPREWHKRNLKRNFSDYCPASRIFGVGYVLLLDYLADLYYHPFVDFEGKEIKYGVISTEKLVEDLNEWTTLYCAGRFHKPVEILRSTPDVEKAYRKNLKHAVNVALFLLPENFSEEDLYEEIAGISYSGDIRMKHAESQDKVGYIVRSNLQGFRELYDDILLEHPLVVRGGDLLVQDCSRLNKNVLPKNLIVEIEKNYEQDLRHTIKIAIGNIVSKSSRNQTLRSTTSAGLLKSIRYVKEKREKATRFRKL